MNLIIIIIISSFLFLPSYSKYFSDAISLQNSVRSAWYNISVRLWNDPYCVEWDVKLYYTILCQTGERWTHI